MPSLPTPPAQARTLPEPPLPTRRVVHLACSQKIAHLLRAAFWLIGITLLGALGDSRTNLAWAAAQAKTPAGITVIDLPEVHAQLSGLFDPEGQLDFDAVSSPQRQHEFAPLGSALNAGYSGGVWWLRVDIHTPTAWIGRTVFLQAWMPDLDEVRFRSPDGREHANGALTAVEARSSRLRVPTLELVLDQPSTTVYLKVRASGSATLIPQLLSPRGVLLTTEWQMLYLGALGGALLIVLIINLVNAIGTREPIFLIYSGLVLSAGLATLSRNGFLHAGWVANPDWLIPLIAAPVHLLAIFANLFSARMLGIGERHPRLFRGLHGLTVLIALGFGLQFTDWVLEANRLIMITILAYGALSLGVSGWDLLRQPERSRSFIFAAYAAFMFAQVISILAMLGYVRATLMTVEAWQFGTWIHLLLLHLALVSGLRDQRRRARAIELEAQVTRAELAEQRRASEDKSRFLEMLAHEINTPLSVIDSTVQSLEMMPGASAPALRERHTRIRSSARRVSRLINETASRDRLDNGAWQVRLSKIAATDLIASVIDPLDRTLALDPQGGGPLLADEIGGAPGWLKIRIEPGLPTLLADQRLVEIALSNLIDNARKYGAPGSTVCVEASAAPPAGGIETRALTLAVTSSGCRLEGIPLERLFEKYHRGHTHPDVPGIGLGLHLVRSIAQLHGGAAGVETLSGPALRFWLTLPCDETH
jgi:signal transduction histidine kinase